jgi:hypothetical protein
VVYRSGTGHGKRADGSIQVSTYQFLHLTRLYVEELKMYHQAYSQIAADARKTLDNLDDIKQKYEFVEGKSESLKSACEKLLEEQVAL